MTSRIELTNPTKVLLEEIAGKEFTRNSISATYSLALRSSGVDWPTVNKAIIERWSFAGLEYIKKRAWRYHTAIK